VLAEGRIEVSVLTAEVKRNQEVVKTTSNPLAQTTVLKPNL